jgi:hypothetical protein
MTEAVYRQDDTLMQYVLSELTAQRQQLANMEKKINWLFGALGVLVVISNSVVAIVVAELVR